MRAMKTLLTVVLTNVLLAGGCLSFGNNYWSNLIGQPSNEYLYGNDAAFDLFQDDFDDSDSPDDQAAPDPDAR